MKQSYLLFFLIIIFGCGSSTEPETGKKIGADISVAVNGPSKLDGGGRWFNKTDTGTWYDATLYYAFRNTSSSVHTIHYRVTFDGIDDIFFDSTGIFTGDLSLAPNQTTTIPISMTVGMGRKSKDWSKPYRYTILFYDSPSDSTSFDEALDGSNPDNRFHGIIYTTEQSPDAQGLLDAPDDGDLKFESSNGFYVEGMYPNPASKDFSIGWVLQKEGAVSFTLNRTPKDILFTEDMHSLLSPGNHMIEFSLDSIKTHAIRNGTYRFYFKGTIDNSVFTYHGDLMVIDR